MSGARNTGRPGSGELHEQARKCLLGAVIEGCSAWQLTWGSDPMLAGRIWGTTFFYLLKAWWSIGSQDTALLPFPPKPFHIQVFLFFLCCCFGNKSSQFYSLAVNLCLFFPLSPSNGTGGWWCLADQEEHRSFVLAIDNCLVCWQPAPRMGVFLSLQTIHDFF